MISLTRKIRSGYIIAFLLLLISYILIFMAIRKVVTEDKDVSRLSLTITTLEKLKGEIISAETSVRGYLITRDVQFLRPYNYSQRNIPQIFSELKELNIRNRQDMQSVHRVEQLTEQRFTYLKQAIERFERNNFTIMPLPPEDRERMMAVRDSINSHIESLQAIQNDLMLTGEINVDNFFTSVETIVVSSLAIALFTLIFSLITYNKENKAKELADSKARQYRGELESNIKELKHMNEELQELRGNEKFSATGRIARTIAHEVRNPLTNISLAAEQLQEMAVNNPDSSVLLDMISRNAGRINQLVSDLLNATRFVQLEFEKVNINDLLEETLLQAKDRIELNNIQVIKKFETGICEITVDREKIKLALLNIIVNAIEAMEKNKGILELVTRDHQGKCIIEVKDNGTGMDEDTIQKLFEPYFTSKQKGNGLGLTNTQNIILNHHGTIRVLSKPGTGTTFIITLEYENKV